LAIVAIMAANVTTMNWPQCLSDALDSQVLSVVEMSFLEDESACANAKASVLVHEPGTHRGLNPRHLVAVAVISTVHAQDLTQGLSHGWGTLTQLAQRLLQQFLPSKADAFQRAAGVDGAAWALPRDTLLGTQVVTAAVHKGCHDGDFTLVRVQEALVISGAVGVRHALVNHQTRGHLLGMQRDGRLHVGTYQIVVGKDVLQERVELAQGALGHTQVDVLAIVSNGAAVGALLGVSGDCGDLWVCAMGSDGGGSDVADHGVVSLHELGRVFCRGGCFGQGSAQAAGFSGF